MFALPFDVATGWLGSRRTLVTVAEELGVPDGAAIDAESGYWRALHGGSRLRRYHPDGRFNREVMLPVSQPTICAFAGRDLEFLVVTSAADQLTAEQRAAQPHAGGLFCLKPGVRGLPGHHLVA